MPVETLLAAADLCLYRSKQNGRNLATGLQIAATIPATVPASVPAELLDHQI